MRGLPRVLRSGQFARFYLGYTTSTLGSQMAPVAITFAVLAQGHRAAGVSAVLAAETLPLVLLLLVGGTGGDRWGRRRTMVGADVARFAAQASLAGWLLSSHPPLVAICALSAVVGAGTAFFVPSLTGLMPQIVAPEQLGQANALTGLADSLGGALGPAVGGLVVAFAGAGWAVAVDAASYLVSVSCLVGLPAPAIAATGSSFLRSLREGWQDFRSRTWLWVIVAQFALFHMLSLAPFTVLGAVIAVQRLGGARVWGLVLGALGLGSVLGGLVMLRWHPRRPLVVATSAVATWCLPPWLLAAHAPAGWVAAGTFLAGVSFGVFGPLWNTTLQREVPAHLLSRVSAYDWLGSLALLPVGYALAGPVSLAIGVGPTLVVSGAYMLLSVAVVLAVPGVRQIRAERPDRPSG